MNEFTDEEIITYLIRCVNDYEKALCGDRCTTRDNLLDAMREAREIGEMGL